MEIVDFLRARYNEARRAEESKRRILPSVFDGHNVEWVADHEGQRLLVDGHPYPIEKYQKIATEAAPDQFMLDDLDAKLAIVDEFAPEPTESETDAQMHARFAHPAYEYRTTEGPRKQWDNAEVPPADDNGDPDPTWERNTDAGRNGWERWDYTEESYWRRLLPEGRHQEQHLPYVLLLLARPYRSHPDFNPAWVKD